ncbi:MAG: transaldolase [Gammaproteobacteria bacterium]|nr:transaldolase [Gammaproteobacteria bacterium]
MNTLQRLEQQGQSIWYDNISRSLITGGELARMVDDGLLGVTSNPTIFEKAIAGSSDYDEQIRSVLAANPTAGVDVVIRALMVEDIRSAADVLMPVYARTHGRDGYVSVEVTPSKARDSQATLEEARSLWAEINRKNLMVKIPATPEGVSAVEDAIYEGININATLIFSVERYREIAGAFLAGLTRRARAGKSVTGIASVASVFVSRIDSLVDDLLTQKMAGMPDATVLVSLRGKAAIANSKIVYDAFKDHFTGASFEPLRQAGAQPQRPLWASTGVKNPAYSDVLYVDSLVGPHTVNTVPPATFLAILDHGQVGGSTIESDADGAYVILDQLNDVGVDFKAVMKKLEDDGIAAFERSFDGLYRNVEEKMHQVCAVSQRANAA